jgi:hypothetical protein
MTTRKAAPWALVSTAFAALFAAGCGITVLVPGGTDGAGGQGGDTTTTSTSSETTTVSSTTSSGVPPPPMGCTASCSQPSNGVDSCNCVFNCDGFPGNAKAECEPNVDLQGNLKTKCVCTVDDEFTGVCFEKDPAHLCDFNLGCCGKYLGK